MSERTSPKLATKRVVVAWVVHLVTASGVIFALLSLDALWREAWREVLLWLFVALAIDGVDGTLARKLMVGDYAPRIDGTALDLIVDYLNYVLVPSLLIWRAELIPRDVALPLCGLILISSLYVFVRRDMKTDDGYFRGFPALWNVVAAYLLLIAPGPWVCAAIILALSLASFAPILVVHPFRAKDFPVAAPMLAIGWLAFTLALLLPPGQALVSDVMLAGSVTCLAGLALMGLWRSARRRSAQPAK